MTPEERNEMLSKYQEEYEKRLLVCARCNQRTNNTHQGHYWAWCRVTKDTREFHFCCPDNCQLESKDG